MFEVHQTAEFSSWLEKLTDVRARAAVITRLGRLALGNPGDARPVGEGVSELRIDVGAGYRAYYLRTGRVVVLMLVGGDKGSQDQDIRRAIKMARELRAADKPKGKKSP